MFLLQDAGPEKIKVGGARIRNLVIIGHPAFMIDPRGLGDSCAEVVNRDQLNLPPQPRFHRRQPAHHLGTGNHGIS